MLARPEISWETMLTRGQLWEDLEESGMLSRIRRKDAMQDSQTGSSLAHPSTPQQAADVPKGWEQWKEEVG